MPIDPKIYLLIHVMLSLVGLIAGLAVVGGFAAGVRLRGWTGLFLVTTLLTSLTGFGFPFVALQPAHVVGAVSVGVLLAAFATGRGASPRSFAVLCVVALYLNAFVLLAQVLQKTPTLAQLAPAPNAPAFALTQGLVLLLFVALGVLAFRGMRAPGAGA